MMRGMDFYLAALLVNTSLSLLSLLEEKIILESFLSLIYPTFSTMQGMDSYLAALLVKVLQSLRSPLEKKIILEDGLSHLDISPHATLTFFKVVTILQDEISSPVVLDQYQSQNHKLPFYYIKSRAPLLTTILVVEFFE